MYKPISRILNSSLLLILIGTFGSIAYYLKAAPSLTPVEAAPPVPLVSDTSVPDTGWSPLQPGLERRVIPVYDTQNGRVESFHIWRLDQKYFRIDVAFDGMPRSLQTWQKETNATLVVNGGYFSIENKRYFPDGLTIVNGKGTGSSFDGFGGMLVIDGSGADFKVARPGTVQFQ